MTADAIGAGTINRLAELRTGGGPTLSVYLDLETETLSTSDRTTHHWGAWTTNPACPTRTLTSPHTNRPPHQKR